jgi:uncharacterized protein YcsI (UPF0317 family)
MVNAETLKPAEARQIIREGRYIGVTGNWCMGYAKANLAVLPKSLAYDFLLFCVRNPKPCPVLDVTEVGSPEPRHIAPGADIRYDIPKYRIIIKGEVVDEPTDIAKYWRDDMVAFLTGCSFSFEEALLKAGIPSRYLDNAKDQVNPIYKSNIDCEPSGRFHGKMACSMRPIPAKLVPRAVQVTSRFPNVHGAPLHIGDPATIGIKDINTPDWGAAPTLLPGDVPVFWACGITPQLVALSSKPEIMITHYPANMFISDVTNESLAVL